MKLKYMWKNPKTDIWHYKRQHTDKSSFVRSFSTEDQAEAERLWPKMNATFEREAMEKRIMAKFKGSKDARREKFWEAVARWLIQRKAGNGGRLPRVSGLLSPDAQGFERKMHGVKWTTRFDAVPVQTRLTSHVFVVLRNDFLVWVSEHDPVAAAVFEMGDMNDDHLFRIGIVAAYFTMSEVDRLA